MRGSPLVTGVVFVSCLAVLASCRLAESARSVLRDDAASAAFRVELGRDGFSPRTLVVDRGATVEFSSSSGEHRVTIPALDWEADVRVGSPVRKALNANAGFLEVRCLRHGESSNLIFSAAPDVEASAGEPATRADRRASHPRRASLPSDAPRVPGAGPGRDELAADGGRVAGDTYGEAGPVGGQPDSYDPYRHADLETMDEQIEYLEDFQDTVGAGDSFWGDEVQNELDIAEANRRDIEDGLGPRERSLLQRKRRLERELEVLEEGGLSYDEPRIEQLTRELEAIEEQLGGY